MLSFSTSRRCGLVAPSLMERPRPGRRAVMPTKYILSSHRGGRRRDREALRLRLMAAALVLYWKPGRRSVLTPALFPDLNRDTAGLRSVSWRRI
jgi:hypothetical protein